MGEGTGSFGKRRNKTLRNKAPFLNPDNLDGTNSDKKRKVVARNKKREGAKLPEAETTEIVVSTSPSEVYDGKISAGMSDKKKKKLKIKQRNKESTKEDGVCEYVPYSTKVGDDSNEQSGKHLQAFTESIRSFFTLSESASSNWNSPNSQTASINTDYLVSLGISTAASSNDILDGANSIKKRKKVVRKKKIKGAELPEAETTETVRRDDDDEEGKNSSAGMSNKKKNKLKKKKRNKENTKVEGVCELVRHSNEAGDDSNQQSKSKGATQLKDDASLLDEDEDEVYQISSGDEDETTGMKTAEGGWTVVKHIKGRKKTTDGESGTTMGSVAQAAVIDKMSKKKKDKQHV
ncbi:hypothetical protein Ccrd_006513, partial [Cynara cardunculus var. scolymus]